MPEQIQYDGLKEPDIFLMYPIFYLLQDEGSLTELVGTGSPKPR